MTLREERLSLERLHDVVSYDPDTGIFRWRKVTSNRVKIGDVCGQLDRHGHRSINIDGLRYMAHRLAWFYVHGIWPVEEIDHINRIKDDNRISNLRDCTRTQNNRNVGIKRHNKVGLKGVSRHSQCRHKFVAQITIGGRPKYLGIFDTPEEAHETYKEASMIYHGKYGSFT